MKKIVKSIVAVLLIVVMCFTCVGCSSDKKEIQNLMLEFEYACNTLDFDAVINCLDPRISDKIKLASGLIGVFTQTDTDELFESLSEYLLENDSVGGTDFFSSIKIDIEEVEIEDEIALVTTRIKYNITGEEMEREAVFNCVYYTDKWYISAFSFE